MKKLVNIFAIIGLLSIGCVKVETTPTASPSPSGPMTPTVFPTLTGYFFQTIMDGDTMTFNELDNVKNHDLNVTTNSIRIRLLESNDVALRGSEDEKLVDGNTWTTTNRMIIEYKDNNGVVWTSPVLDMDQHVRVDVEEVHKNSVITSKETFKCNLSDNSGNTIAFENGLFRALVATSNNQAGNTIQFVLE